MIEVNALRGYALESWQFATVIDPGPRMIVETIVAVFVDVRTLTFTTEGTEEGESRTGS